MIESERLTLASLRVAHAHLDATILAATRGKVHASPLKDFVPTFAPPEPVPVRTFETWSKSLLALAG